jgi:hypothetical protein
MTDDTLDDVRWFMKHRHRCSRIRASEKGEAENDFLRLGDHDRERRRMIILRIPDGPHHGALIWMPVVLYSDETVENTDEVLMPIVHEFMQEARGELH